MTRRATALHEASHLVAALRAGFAVESAELRPGGGGIVQLSIDPRRVLECRRMAQRWAFVIAAGPAADDRFCAGGMTDGDLTHHRHDLAKLARVAAHWKARGQPLDIARVGRETRALVRDLSPFLWEASSYLLGYGKLGAPEIGRIAARVCV